MNASRFPRVASPLCPRTARPSKVLVSSIAAILASFSAHAAVVVQNESNTTGDWVLPPGANLLAGATTSPPTAVVHEASSASWATLTDGLLGTAVDKTASVTPNNGD